MRRINVGERVMYAEAAGGLMGHLVRHGEVLAVEKIDLAAANLQARYRVHIQPEPLGDEQPRPVWVAGYQII